MLSTAMTVIFDFNHDLPPEPLDLVKSNIKFVQEPIIWGLVIEITGDWINDGNWIVIVCVLIYFQVKHELLSIVHFALINPPIKVTLLEIVARFVPLNITVTVAESIQVQVEVSEPINVKYVEHKNSVVRYPWSVGESNLRISLIPSDEKIACVKLGGSGSILADITLKKLPFG